MGRRAELADQRPRPDGVGSLPVRRPCQTDLGLATMAAGSWGASVTTWLEAREQMASLAADVRAFVA